jgi:hypothetical protein
MVLLMILQLVVLMIFQMLLGYQLIYLIKLPIMLKMF